MVKKTLLLLTLLLASCAPSPSEPAPQTEGPITTPSAIPSDTPSHQPTVVKNSNGVLIYDDGENISAINADTGEVQVLVSRKELHFIVGEDRSADSYTYGYAKPITVVLSPDLKKAYVSLCAALDSRFRCVVEDFIYKLEEKSVVPLPKPTDTFGVYWQWSPDGTKLGGAGWKYVGANYEIKRFYIVNSDGSDLKTLESVTNEHWLSVWDQTSTALLPMTFITNFRSMFTDGTEKDIPVEGLEWDDKVQCLAFSPDGKRSAFVVRRDQPKDHDRVYIAASDFTGLSLVTEYDIDSTYLCTLTWSPDQTAVHVSYGSDPRAEIGEGEELPVLDKVIRVESGQAVEVPNNSQVCGWTPTNDLVYQTNNSEGQPAGVAVLPLAESEAVRLPEGVMRCPTLWLKDAPVWNIPAGLSVPDACHPGKKKTEDPQETGNIPPIFDLVEATSSLSGEVLSVTMTMNAVENDLNLYTTPGVTEFLNGWDVFVDIDNNALTGDGYGVEYRLSVAIRPGSGGNPAAIGSAVLKFDPSSKSYSPVDRLQFLLNADGTLVLRGTIPGVTENSRLVFLSRLVDKASNSVIGDRICN